MARQKMHLNLKKGALHRNLGIPQGQKIPASRLAAAAKRGGIVGKRARLAKTMRTWHHGGRRGR